MNSQGMFYPARFLYVVALSFLIVGAHAQGAKPLSLEAALQAADAPHPDLQLAEAERDLALADQAYASARRDLGVTLEGRLQGAKSTLPNSDFSADNSVRLAARKNLYDFGRSENNIDAARSVAEARERELLDTRDQRRIDIMARYFDVLLADLRAVADDEFMTVAFLNFDRAREAHEQKLVSTVDMRELESRFQNLLEKRNFSRRQQRFSRELLAEAMNQPGQLVSELEDPKLPGNQRVLPSFDALSTLVDQSPKVQSSRKLVEASRQRLAALRADTHPTLDAELEAAEYPNRRLQGRDNLRAGVVLTWPLYQGGRNSAQLAREQAQFYKLQAETEKVRRTVSLTLLRLLSQAEQLQTSARNAAKIQTDYRDLALERARAQYEVELKTNLGESSAFTVEAKLRQREVEYQLALALAKLEALLGQPLPKAKSK